MAQFDIAVVGLGALGAATCRALGVLGDCSVIGIDRFSPPHDMGSTHGHTRMIREAYWENPLYVPIVRRAYQLWEELGERAGRELLRRTGGLMIGPGDGPLISGSRRSAEIYGIPVECLSNAELVERFGAVFHGLDDLEATVEPNAGFLWLEPTLEAQLDQAREDGVDLRFGSALERWRAGDGGIELEIQTGERLSGEKLSAGRLLLCCGGWLPRLVPGLEGLALERQVQHWVDLDEANGREAARGFAIGEFLGFLFEDQPGENWYGFPDVGRGLKVGIHHRGAVTSIESIDRTSHDSDRQPVLEKLRSHLPAASGRPVRSSVCFYTNTPDRDFLIDWHPGYDRDAGPAVLIATACSGHGFKFASALGEILARLLTDRDPGFDLSPFAWREGLRVS